MPLDPATQLARLAQAVQGSFLEPTSKTAKRFTDASFARLKPPNILQTSAPPMSELPQEATLLAELDRRQNDVLTQLDTLNEKVEQLLQECLTARSAELEAAGLE